MPFYSTDKTRRRFLASFLSLAAAPAEGFSLFGKTKAQNLGKVYEYLQDGHLRAKELGRQRVTIKNVDFTNVEFKGTSWQYFDFVDCDFAGMFSIRLEWLTESTFTNCNFRGILELGDTRDVRFINCAMVVNGDGGITFSSRSTGLVFEGCTFRNSNYDLNHMGGILCVGEISFIDCRAEGFALGGDKKLTLKKCVMIDGHLDSASPGAYRDKSQMPYSDFLLEDCDFTRGVEMINAKLNSFTMRNCKLGIFQTAGSTARGDVLVENIRQGYLDLVGSDFQGKLTVRDCSFYATAEGHSFKCNTDTPRYSLIENVQCGQAPADVICSGGPMKESDWLPVASNQSTIIRNCDIPHLHVDWAQTEHLRIENCTFDTLLIRNGRIGKLEIIDCSLKKLDVSNTQVKEQSIRVPKGCDIIATDSNIKPLPRE